MRTLFSRSKSLPALMASLITLCLSFPGQAVADDDPYPSKTIYFIVGFAAGGGADTVVRVIAKNLTIALKQPVVVENIPGANANIAANKTAHSKPDGYTIMMSSVPNAVNATLYRHLSYDPVKDFTPVIGLASVPMILTVATSSPITSVQDLIALAKQKPGQLTFSSGGVGSLEHLSGLSLEQAAGIKLTHIPYKGSGESIIELISGRISLAFNSMPSVLPHINSGKLRAVAIGDTERTPFLPNTPTMAEAGLPSYSRNRNWFGVVAPAGTPKDVVLKLNTEMSKILQLVDVKTLLHGLGDTPMGGSPEQFGQLQSADIAKYATLIKTFDLHAD
jgi:tripartite-type tricarboxylate transporter receptor subunit TctC